ncbi:rna-directed dna polymerase from mobile element jockey- hypothetical protein [Limosa lapponica baueri]|uniref:Rna-directed dna polymerase from mobile element jockey-like n=1 Tax=Limosa lapponica baueri TaxID=1758121 RepID=A0A2I0UNU4_LIMLA|nr:rna-directed dna polymerase from mobile element jockey- hypothetical protein [Limosa lapponica baueri]
MYVRIYAQKEHKQSLLSIICSWVLSFIYMTGDKTSAGLPKTPKTWKDEKAVKFVYRGKELKALRQEILNQGGEMTSWITSIPRGMLASVGESLHKANVTLDQAATDCFTKERQSSRSGMVRDESMCVLAKAISVPTCLPFLLTPWKEISSGGNVVRKDKEKAEVLNDFFASVFNCKTSCSLGTQVPDLDIRDRKENEAPIIKGDMMQNSQTGSGVTHRAIIRESGCDEEQDPSSRLQKGFNVLITIKGDLAAGLFLGKLGTNAVAAMAWADPSFPLLVCATVSVLNNSPEFKEAQKRLVTMRPSQTGKPDMHMWHHLSQYPGPFGRTGVNADTGDMG